MRGIMELGRSAYLRSEKLPHTMQHAIHGQQNEHPKSATKMGKNPPTVVQIFPFPSWEMPTTWMQRSLLSDISWMSMESCCKIGDISSDMNLPSRRGSCDAAPKRNLEPKHDNWLLPCGSVVPASLASNLATSFVASCAFLSPWKTGDTHDPKTECKRLPAKTIFSKHWNRGLCLASKPMRLYIHVQNCSWSPNIPRVSCHLAPPKQR